MAKAKLSEALTHLEMLNGSVLGLDGATPAPSGSKHSFDILPQKLRQDSKAIVLPLEQIIVQPDRIRQYFDSEKTQSLVQSIQAFGFLGSLWVRQVEGEYYLVAGGRRYAACQQAGVKEVTVEILNVSNAEAIQLELLENFQREDLNPVEETEGILKMLEVTLELSRAEVVALLNRRAYEKRGKAKMAIADIDVRNSGGSTEGSAQEDLWPVVEQIFQVVGKYNPESFRTHRLPLLRLPESILQAVWTGQLEYSKARLIGRVKDEGEQKKLLAQAINQGLTQAEISTAVRQLNDSESGSTVKGKSREQQLQNRTKQLSRSLKIRFAALTSREQSKVEKLLSQLEEILTAQDETRTDETRT